MFRPKKKINVREDEDLDEDDVEDDDYDEGMAMMPSNKESRTIGLFGPVEEEKAAQLIGIMLELASDPDAIVEIEAPEGAPEDRVREAKILPIEFLISTPGGSADDMFAIYDIMRVVKDQCDIVTFGLGKVMSAGVLLLAAGTKGQRKIGKSCRVMIHSVVGGTSGSFHNLENEISEMRFMQNSYLKALSDESKMSVPQLKKMIGKKVNVYLSAEQAVKLGIADIII